MSEGSEPHLTLKRKVETEPRGENRLGMSLELAQKQDRQLEGNCDG